MIAREGFVAKQALLRTGIYRGGAAHTGAQRPATAARSAAVAAEAGGRVGRIGAER